MPSFTDVAGVAMSAHRGLLHDLLRVKWGFNGVIISDYNAIAELMLHGVAADLMEAATLALKAGIDIDMMAGAYEKGLPLALERGLVSMDEIDACVRRVLHMKEEMGLFEDPYRGLEQQSPGPDTLPHHRQSARDAARRSLVLIKNDGDLLPLSRNIKRIAAIGPLADKQSELMGPWCMAGDEREAIGFLQGLREVFAQSEILHAKGSAVEDAIDADLVAQAVKAAHASDVVVLCLGEDRQHCGEAASRTKPEPFACQLDLARAVIATGKPVILVTAVSRPWILPDWLVDGSQAILLAMFGGTEAGRATADIIAGDYNPSARLSISWPVNAGQIPAYYNMRSTGRPHDPNNGFSTNFLDAPIEPRFTLGDGLSYTRFELGALQADQTSMDEKGLINLVIDVQNVGARDGEATLFLFIHDPVAQVTRPSLELKDFAKAELKAGQSKTVRFVLRADQLRYPGLDLEPRLDNGRIDIIIGTSAHARDQKRVSIEVKLKG